MADFVHDAWRPILEFNGIRSFDELWVLEAEWFEPPNERRGGWSGVCRCELRLPGGGSRAIFLKRQENHGTKSFRHPVSGIPTFKREFDRIMAYRRCAVPTLVPVFFGTRNQGGNQRAILATEELEGFESLEDWVQRWKTDGKPGRKTRQLVIQSVAALLRQMHRHGIRHGCFFPKHVFIRFDTDSGHPEVRVIDLEKSRRRPLHALCALRDLYSLSHYSSSAWSHTERVRFLRHYLDVPRLTRYAKWLWRKVAQRSDRKREMRAMAGS